MSNYIEKNNYLIGVSIYQMHIIYFFYYLYYIEFKMKMLIMWKNIRKHEVIYKNKNDLLMMFQEIFKEKYTFKLLNSL